MSRLASAAQVALLALSVVIAATPVPDAWAAGRSPAGSMPAADQPSAAVATVGRSTATIAIAASADYPPATWIAASTSNYSVANRAHDHPIDMIVIHDTEGSYSSAITMFQDPNRHGSAHYVVSYKGQVTQMVREKDIAWHAGNWDYNTRSIGIEHEGYAWTAGLYTNAEYKASAHLAASICSRWGVPMDRQHVIGHNEVPDPNNPSLFGGAEHHTDPGPYWDWTYYMGAARAYAAALPSPPHMMPDPVAVNGLTSVTVTWRPARSCHLAISGYTVVGQPGNLTMNLPATATSATFDGLQMGVSYTFTVTATNPDGQDSATSNPAIPGRCNNVGVAASPASPQLSGTQVQVTATSSSCPNPEYQFWLLAPGSGTWQMVQDYGGSTFTWTTLGKPAGTYRFSVWAEDAASPGTFSNSLGHYDDFNAGKFFTLTSIPCTSVAVSASPPPAKPVGTAVSVTGAASGCPNPHYQFWILNPGSSTWRMAQDYTTGATYSWNTIGKPAGTYRFSVWARDTTSTGAFTNSLGSYDAFNAGQYYTLTSSACTSVSVSASPAAAAMVGTAVSINGNALGCLHANPLYRFWILAPGAGAWALAQDYSTSATYNWDTTGKAAGTYRFSVWVHDSSSAGAFTNSLGSYDAFNAGQFFTLTPGCSSVSVSASPSSPRAAGTPVVITGAASGCLNANPLYQFWILDPGSSTWRMAQDYSTSASYDWSTTGQAAGTYRFSVWVHDAANTGVFVNSLGRYDAFNAGQFFKLG